MVWSGLEKIARDLIREDEPAFKSPHKQVANNTCKYWNCNEKIRRGYYLCSEHYAAFEKGDIDECPGCKGYKPSEYEMCLACVRRGEASTRTATSKEAKPPQKQRRYRKEHKPEWEKNDSVANRFYVYILQLDDGSFYAGHSRDLRARMWEHKDGQTKSTAGRSPRLQWFEIVSSRDEAASQEVDLKKLIDKNPREVRKLVIEFKDLISELEFR